MCNLARTSVFLTLLAIFLVGCGAPEPVRLGFISGQTGAFADLGSAGLNGAILAVEQRNRQGGVAGRPVTLIIRDDEHAPAKARAAFQALLKERVVAVVGPMTSAMAVELIPLAQEAGIVLMGGTVVTHRVSGKDDLFLRAIADTRHYAAYSAVAHQRHFKPGRVHVVFDAANRDYAENWARDYIATMNALGVRHTEIFEIDSRQPQSMQSKLFDQILRDAPDLLSFATSARTAATLIVGVRERNAAVRTAVSAWAANRLLLENAAQAAEGTLVEQYHDLFDPRPNYQDFVSRYRERFQLEPDYAAVVAYDATTLILDGLQLNPRKEGLKEALVGKQRFTGLQTAIELDRFGDALRPGFTTHIRDGKFAPLD